jgi:hypothetical protein
VHEPKRNVGVRYVSNTDERKQFSYSWRERMVDRKRQLREEVIEMEFDISQMVSQLSDDNWESRSMKKRLDEMIQSRDLIYSELDLISPVEVS